MALSSLFPQAVCQSSSETSSYSPVSSFSIYRAFACGIDEKKAAAAAADVDDRKARRELLRFVFCGDGGADKPHTDDGPRTKKMHNIKRKLIRDGISAITSTGEIEPILNE